MISLQERIDLLSKLGEYIKENSEEWQQAKDMATRRNSWFTPESVDMAADGIADCFLKKELLTEWAARYPQSNTVKNVGLVMAGNIPMVGFHDFLCVFVSGHKANIKLSSKDDVLLKHLIEKLIEWQPQVAEHVVISENLKGCDAYIATGSNNSARYFEQYFGKFPNIIRKNRTSVAALSGNETNDDFLALGKDIFSYFGLGCRNVTKVYLPTGYDTSKLLEGLMPYKDIFLNHKYKNNYDYHLAIYLLNKVPYQTNDFLLLLENAEPFSAISSLHYEFYDSKEQLLKDLQNDDRIQAVVENVQIPFGRSQYPGLADYADGVDTMLFLSSL